MGSREKLTILARNKEMTGVVQHKKVCCSPQMKRRIRRNVAPPGNAGLKLIIWREHTSVYKNHQSGDLGLVSTPVLKGLSHEIFGPVYWPVWIHIGLNKNRFWFLNFKEAPSI
jgi:hypothetical protein